MAGANVGAMYRLGEALVLGRDNHAAVQIDSPEVSRRHARVYLTGSGFFVEDLGSRNGTLLNGSPVLTPQPLADGDKLSLGGTVFRFALFDELDDEYQQRIYDSSLRDPLTRAFNRAYLDERLDAEIAYSLRHDTALALLVFDVDHFKKINDTYGHVVGDQVLVQLTQHVLRVIRAEDVLVRYGGEEFVVLSRDIREAEAIQFAERLRSAVERQVFLHELPGGGSVAVPVTISVGVASMPSPDIHQASHLIERADAALYAAKEAGRNRVEKASGTYPSVASGRLARRAEEG
jgi:diguanylate cyclase (GGDEF)-like protein